MKGFLAHKISSYRGLLAAALMAVWALLLSARAFGFGLQAQTSASSYAAQILPIFQQKCLACHSSAAKMGELIMDSYETLMKGGAHGQDILPGRSSESRLVMMLEGKAQPRMPFGGDALPPADIAAIKAWIDAGAKGPAPGEAVGSAPTVTIPDIKPQVPVVSPVGSIAFSLDGKLLAVGSYREVRLIDVAARRLLATLSGHAGLVRGLAFGPGTHWLAAAGGLPGRSGEIKLWDAQTHALLRTLEGHKDCVYSVAASPDGKLLASGSYDRSVKLWDVETGKELRDLRDHIDAVFAVAFSPDGKYVASGSQDRTLKVWDVASGERLFTLSDALDGITTLAYHPSGKQIAAAGYDKTIRVWDLTDKSGSLAQSLIADEDIILQLVYSPDGKVLVSSSADGSVRFRDAASLNPIKVLDKQPDWVQALSMSPDGKLLAAGRNDGSVSVYDTGSYKQILGPLVVFEPYRSEGGSSTAEARNGNVETRN